MSFLLLPLGACDEAAGVFAQLRVIFKKRILSLGGNLNVTVDIYDKCQQCRLASVVLLL